MKQKKGVFFSTDALMALSVIMLTMLIVVPFVLYAPKEKYIESDLIEVMSTLKIGDINDSYVEKLIKNGNITDLNDTILEQIGKLYIENINISINLSKTILNYVNISDNSSNIGIWCQGELLASKNISAYKNAETINIERKIISGIQNNTNFSSVTGYSGRAYLSSKAFTEHFYFGGYIGDGNISLIFNISGNATDAWFEVAVNNPFDIYINGNFSGSYPNSTEFTPVKRNLTAYAQEHFQEGENLIEFIGNNLYIAGGYIKVLYTSENLTNGNGKYNFPGVEGIINVYDSFYIPSNLTEMNISLHMNTSFEAFLTIGNVTVFNGSTNDEEYINRNDSTLSSKLNYSELSGKTVPIRLGLKNVSYGVDRKVDVFSVTDISGSMDDGCGWGCNEFSCTSCNSNCPICEAKNATKVLIDIILNATGNNIGLVGYESSAENDDFHNLTDDNESLINHMYTQWDANGGTCICCGINKAVQEFNSNYQRILCKKCNEGIVAYYKFEDNVLDSSGRGNDGNSNGNPVYVDGTEDKGIELDGNDWIGVPDTDDINTDTHAKRTIIAWFNVTDKDIADKQVIYEEGGGSRGLNIYIYQGKLFVGGWNEPAGESNWQGTWLNTSSINNNQWHQVALVLNGTSSLENEVFKGYIDGVEFSNGSGSQLWDHGGDIQIGRNEGTKFHDGDDNSDGEYFTGVIDEIKIYNRVLNATEIQGIPLSNVCGDGWKNSTEDCDDGNNDNFDGCNENCSLEKRYWSMVVMSDGHATTRCNNAQSDFNDDGSVDEEDDAIQASCDAYSDYGIEVHSVGFGSGADENLLKNISECGNGLYNHSDVGNLEKIYQEIANRILKASYFEQTVNATEGVKTFLYPDSYIKFNYTIPKIKSGLYVTVERLFEDNQTGNFSVPFGYDIVEATAISYSGPRWTSLLRINNSVDDAVFYNLSDYKKEYIKLGDPYAIKIPLDLINKTSLNIINLLTGVSHSNQTVGSVSNKIIYTLLKGMISYSSISAYAEGCEWFIQFEDDTNTTMKVPYDYSKEKDCYYNETSIMYDENDAIQEAVFKLLESLDFDSDGKVNSKFTDQDLVIGYSEVIGIPFGYSVDMEVRSWS
ncbi:hypothetical protein GF386_00360 [Candidatus Pacearchaeota archaeon]|nr:hypothetical protein [Candidatus Pacearchaeota archaeon]MBD3282735.1 hypothetical protein [Candidatus Pacearchaeota archaeon]